MAASAGAGVTITTTSHRLAASAEIRSLSHPNRAPGPSVHALRRGRRPGPRLRPGHPAAPAGRRRTRSTRGAVLPASHASLSRAGSCLTGRPAGQNPDEASAGAGGNRGRRPPWRAEENAGARGGVAGRRLLRDPGRKGPGRADVSAAAGQRVVFSYSGLTVPAVLLRQISAGQAAGVIFFGGNISNQAQIASVIQQLPKRSNRARCPRRCY